MIVVMELLDLLRRAHVAPSYPHITLDYNVKRRSLVPHLTLRLNPLGVYKQEINFPDLLEDPHDASASLELKKELRQAFWYQVDEVHPASTHAHLHDG